jgi:lipid-A-disaccharide synthase
VDHLLCIFPFEQEYFRKRGVRAEFVGHPLAGSARPILTAEKFREQVGLESGRPYIALLPGSRMKEVRLNLPPMLETAERLAGDKRRGFVLPVASTIPAEWVRSLIAGCRAPVTIVENRAYDAVAHAEAVIVASGTAATETALLGKPMVIVYRVSGVSWLLGRWMVRVPYFSMVNLVAGHAVAPEFIQNRYRPEAVAEAVREILEVPAVRQRMTREVQEVADQLRAPVKDRIISARAGVEREEDPIERAAAAAESLLEKRGVLSRG